MKIIHLSDTHNRHQSISLIECDLFVHTGDFCNMNFSLDPSIEYFLNFEQAMNFLEWVNLYPAKHKIICSGNHETFLKNKSLAERFRQRAKELNIIFKEKVEEILDLGGIKIAGAGFYPHISNRMPLDNAYFHNENFFASIPQEKIHILIAHACPQFNLQNDYECPEFKQFLIDRIDYFNPINLVLCGHIHESRGEYLIKNTTKIINSACNFKPKIIEFSPDTKWA